MDTRKPQRRSAPVETENDGIIEGRNAVVEALRAGLPMVLSDTQVNREAAGEAAAYVRPEARGEVLAALENALEDVSWRRTMQERERRRAELFSEYAVAERLMQIYTSL